MTVIKRIPSAKLEIGMYISDKTEGLADSRLLAHGFIMREDTLDKIKRNHAREIFIDVGKGKDSPFALPLLVSQTPLKSKVSLREEREKAQRVYGEARGLVSDLLNDVKIGKAIDVSPVEDLAEDINNSILANPNALLCLSQIREKDKYLLEHSVNVGILMSIFATYLNYDKATVKELTTGALLHDIGKIRVPDEVLNKPGKLSSEEWQEMQRHVVYGQKVLAKSEGISDIAKSICALHHERLDGSGYPRGLRESDIDVYGRMAAIVDIYDAVTASRVYHEGMSPFKAMKLLLSISDTHLDKALVYNFIRCMSVYPVGTIVELKNGLLGVVLEPNPLEPNKPKIRIFYNQKKQSEEKAIVMDLGDMDEDFSITRTWHPEELGMDIQKCL